MDENEAFVKWLRELGMLEEACSVGKTYMVNPKANKVLTELMRFFKSKSDASYAFNLKAGLECRPYKFVMHPNPPYLKHYFFGVTTDVDGIGFSAELLAELNEIGQGLMSLSFTGNEDNSVTMHIEIRDYYIELKPNQN
jgi:hypothetical protein